MGICTSVGVGRVTGQQEFARLGGWTKSWTASVTSSPTTVTHHTLLTGPLGMHWILAHAPWTQTRMCISSIWGCQGLVTVGQRHLKCSLFKPQYLLTRIAAREFVLFPSLFFNLVLWMPSRSMTSGTHVWSPACLLFAKSSSLVGTMHRDCHASWRVTKPVCPAWLMHMWFF